MASYVPKHLLTLLKLGSVCKCINRAVQPLMESMHQQKVLDTVQSNVERWSVVERDVNLRICRQLYSTSIYSEHFAIVCALHIPQLWYGGLGPADPEKGIGPQVTSFRGLIQQLDHHSKDDRFRKMRSIGELPEEYRQDLSLLVTTHRKQYWSLAGMDCLVVQPEHIQLLPLKAAIFARLAAKIFQGGLADQPLVTWAPLITSEFVEAPTECTREWCCWFADMRP